MTNAIAASTTLFSLVLLTSILSFKFGAFRRFMEARPTVLVKQGQIIARSLGQGSSSNNFPRVPDGQVRWLLDKCDWGAVAAGALRAAKSLSTSSRIALS